MEYNKKCISSRFLKLTYPTFKSYDYRDSECLFSLLCRGLQRLVMKNMVYGMGEMYRGIFIGAQVKILQKYIPELSRSDVLRYKIMQDLINTCTLPYMYSIRG